MKFAIGITILALSVWAVWTVWAVFPNSTMVVEITDFSSQIEASVRAPIRPFGSGAMYVLYEGNLPADATLTVISNRKRDKQEMALVSGKVHGVYGGAEEWVDDLSVVFKPSKSGSGQMKIGLYCGTGFPEEDWAWFNRLSAK